MSEHELELMTLYEALVRMLVSLDLDQNLDLEDKKGKHVARDGPPNKAANTGTSAQNVPPTTTSQAKDAKEGDVWTDERIREYYESEEAAQDLDLLLNFDLREFMDLKAPAANSDKNVLEEEETGEEAAEVRKALAVHAEIDEMLDLAAQVERLEQEHTVVLNSSSSEYEDEGEDDDGY